MQMISVRPGKYRSIPAGYMICIYIYIYRVYWHSMYIVLSHMPSPAVLAAPWGSHLNLRSWRLHISRSSAACRVKGKSVAVGYLITCTCDDDALYNVIGIYLIPTMNMSSSLHQCWENWVSGWKLGGLRPCHWSSPPCKDPHHWNVERIWMAFGNKSTDDNLQYS